MNKNYILTIVIIAIITVGGWFYYQSSIKTETPIQNDAAGTVETGSQMPIDNPAASTGEAVEDTFVGKVYDVSLTADGFSPKEFTVKKGDTVKWTNNGTGNMWVASAMHPAHVVYSGTALKDHCPDADNNDFDQCQNATAGASWSFTFDKVGTWGYHNHSNSSQFGKIIVTE